jgi:hypothetical protein
MANENKLSYDTTKMGIVFNACIWQQGVVYNRLIDGILFLIRP